MNSRSFRSVLISALLALSTLSLGGCGYNTMQAGDEEIKSSWSEVINQYQRRADLIPNLVNVVKGYASHEQEVLTQVTEARAKATSVALPAEALGNEEAFNNFQKAQAGLSSSLGRLLAVAENYPQLKADAGFRDLQAQLEGTENRITVARNRYIESIKQYNIVVRSFPSNLTAMAFGYTIKPNFSVENEAAISSPPKVEFSK